MLEQRGESRPVDSAVRARLDRLTWPQAVCWIGSRLATALGYAHREGVLHRDVKPANVLLAADAVPKLADFNISYCSKLPGVAPAAYFGGSLAYMSPEQLEACNPAHPRSPDSLDGQSDLYSLGVLLWELLTGQRPFGEERVNGDFPQLLSRMATTRRRGIESGPLLACPHGAPGIPRVLQRCLAPEPADRWPSGEELAKQLEFCTDPDIQDYLFPDSRSWRARVRAWLLVSLLLATLVPSAVAAVFNFVYNWQEIVSQMNPAAERHFMLVQTLINGIAFPLGVALIAYLVFPVTLAVRRAREDGPNAARNVQRRALRLGHFAALTCISLWTLAGVAYPAGMRFGDIELPASNGVHFFVSLLLCGLFAVSLTYFSVTTLSLRAALPALLESRLVTDTETADLDAVARSAWRYLAMSASVPMLATATLVAVNSPNVRWYLAVISIGGLAAFAAAAVLCRVVLRDLATLTQIARFHESRNP